MTKRRIRVTLAGLLGAVLLVGSGASVVSLVVLPKLRASKARTLCINHLRQIDSAKDSYALEYGGMEDTLPTATNVAIYIKSMSNCVCPLLTGTNRTFEKSYSINVLTTAPTCRTGHNELNHRLPYGR